MCPADGLRCVAPSPRLVGATVRQGGTQIIQHMLVPAQSRCGPPSQALAARRHLVRVSPAESTPGSGKEVALHLPKPVAERRQAIHVRGQGTDEMEIGHRRAFLGGPRAARCARGSQYPALPG